MPTGRSLQKTNNEENHIVWLTKLFSTAHSPHFKWFGTIPADKEHEMGHSRFQVALDLYGDTHTLTMIALHCSRSGAEVGSTSGPADVIGRTRRPEEVIGRMSRPERVAVRTHRGEGVVS